MYAPESARLAVALAYVTFVEPRAISTLSRQSETRVGGGRDEGTHRIVNESETFTVGTSYTVKFGATAKEKREETRKILTGNSVTG